MSKISLKRENIPLLIFYFAYAIEMLILLIDKSAYINPIEGRLFQLTFLLCTLKVSMTKYTNKEWALILVFLALGAVSYFATDRNEIIRFVMFVAASKGIDLKKLMKATFYVTLIGVLLLMMLSLTGVLGWNYVEADFDGDGPEGIIRRYCLGLGHPNALHCMFFCIILLGIITYVKKLNIWHYILVFVGNLLLYYFTQSVSGAMIVTVLVLLAILLRYFEQIYRNVIVRVLSILFVIFAAIFSVFNAKYSWEWKIFGKLDQYLSGRLRGSYNIGRIDYWSLFSAPENTNFFDLGYSRLFYWYGYIPAIICLIFVCYLLFYYHKKENYVFFLTIVIISMYTFLEAHFVSVYVARNYIIILLFGCWNEVFHVADGKERYFYQLVRRKSK